MANKKDKSEHEHHGCDCSCCHNKCGKETDVDGGVSLLERLFDEENDENVILFDEDGNEIELEQVATVTYENEIYAVLHALGAPEDEVLVFHVNPDDEESITMVADEKVGIAVLKIVMENAE